MVESSGLWVEAASRGDNIASAVNSIKLNLTTIDKYRVYAIEDLSSYSSIETKIKSEYYPNLPRVFSDGNSSFVDIQIFLFIDDESDLLNVMTY